MTKQQNKPIIRHMTNSKLKPNQTFLGIFTVQADGKLKVKTAKTLTAVNQYKTHWKITDSRDLARVINRSELVIK